VWREAASTVLVMGEMVVGIAFGSQAAIGLRRSFFDIGLSQLDQWLRM
jgi:hypothetical protein